METKRLMMADDGINHPSSVHEVVFNDDLLIEILLRLPVISLFFFKSVSKRWLSLITASPTLRRFPNIHPPCGLFLQEIKSTHDSFEHDFVSLDNRIPGTKSAFTFGSFGPDARNVQVLQSCNGLVLCVVRNNPDKIYVYNPSINMFKMLPQVHGLAMEKFLDRMRLAFDPAKSPHYKVLHIRVVAPGGRRQRHSIQTRIYSSETGCWRVFGDTFPLKWFSGMFEGGVYWNDAIHWLDITKRVRHFELDVERPHVTTTKPPKTLDEDTYRELFESRGGLLLADPRPRHLKIYEMRNGYSGWSVRYIVKYQDSIAAFLKTCTERFSAMGFRIRVLVIAVGEREEESFVVMNLYGKVVKYNLLSKTLQMLYDFGSIDRDSAFRFGAFPFIASFAGV